MTRVAIVGVGCVAARPVSPEVSYREITFEAAERAYADAGLRPADVGSFVGCAEDFLEGTSIFDEYTPDQIGGARRPVHTISSDGLTGLVSGVLQIRSGLFETVLVEAHSKASNIKNLKEVLTLGLDPSYVRPWKVDPDLLLGLEMSRWLHDAKEKAETAARVVVKNRGNALKNPLAAYPARLTVEDVRTSEGVADPLRALDLAQSADGAAVVLLASEKAARRLTSRPIWVRGVGWIADSPNLEGRPWGEARHARLAAERAYGEAGIRRPASQIDLAEVDDAASFKEIEHVEALGLVPRGKGGKALERGDFDRGGRLPVNPSGGSLGGGYLFEATALYRVAEAVAQLRGEAGPRQVDGAKTAVVQSWRGIPTATGAVAVLGR